MLFYIQAGDYTDLHITPLAEAEKLGGITEVLLPGLPYGIAHSILEAAVKRGKANDRDYVLKTVQKTARDFPESFRWERAKNLEAGEGNSGFESATIDVLARLEGRQLSETDLGKLAEMSDLPLKDILRSCLELIKWGRAEWLPAVSRDGAGWRCQRCGETQVEEWPSLYGEAATCPSCAALGALSSLQVLFRSRSLVEQNDGNPAGGSVGASAATASHRYAPHWELSKAQGHASLEVLAFVSQNHVKEALLWAACGAGKTEVCFPAAAWALERGQRILFAAPRQDVVHDVEPRLKRDFPGLDLSILTGKSEERFTSAQFLLATTHQLLRFYRAFDLIFLDEMDAFPYQNNPALVWGLRHALKTDGKILYLTATPSQESLGKAERGQISLMRLPARHHRHPVPVPEFVKVNVDFEKERGAGNAAFSRLPVERIRELAASGPLMLFVPKISWVNPLVEALRRAFPALRIEGSYSSDPLRAGKIEGLKGSRFGIFVSTSILERGVTVPAAQVAVLAADHPVFDERALVQMAGRVGRTRETPGGKAVFLARDKTPSITTAIRWIQEQNRLAFRQGLIDFEE